MSATVGVDDATFIRAPVPLVYRRITNVGAWPDWWVGLEVLEQPPLADAERWGLSLRLGPARVLRYLLTCTRWRHDAGLEFRMTGDLTGRAEFWLEPAPGGTVVHHLADAACGLTHARGVATGYRRAVRRGLWGFKDVLQLEMRSSLGVAP